VHRTKEMGAKCMRMGVWIRTHGSTPYLSSQVSSSPSGVALHAHNTCFTDPDADKWVQALLISWHWMMRRWSSGAETESPRIPYVRSPIGSGIVIMITLGPMISAEQ
jgi:hypothetical protein